MNRNSSFKSTGIGNDTSIKISFFFFLLTICSPFTTIAQNSAQEINYSQFVYPGPDGKLVYKPNERGDIIPDFSHAGYRGGGVALPDVPVKLTLSPEAGDNTEHIQQALDRVGEMKRNENGYRGAVFLNAGRYEIAGTLRIRNNGVVLLGAGDYEGGTLLVATGNNRRTLLQIEGEGEFEEVADTRRDIVEEYVPVGARSFNVEDSGGFNVGDKVIVYRPSTAEWISAIGMDRIPLDTVGSPTIQWAEGSRDLKFDRVITAIDGNKITIDAPLTHSLDQDYGGGYIFTYSFPGRLSEVGVGHLFACRHRMAGSTGPGKRSKISRLPN